MSQLPKLTSGTDVESWRDEMYETRAQLIGAFMNILETTTEPETAASLLHALFSPYNEFEADGTAVNHLRALEVDDAIHIESHDNGDVHERVVLIRHMDGVWRYNDLPLEEPLQHTDLHHENIASYCLSLVWWGNEDLIESVAGYAKTLQKKGAGMKIGDEVRYVGTKHPSLRGARCLIIAVHRDHAGDPDRGSILRDEGTLVCTEDLVEVVPYIEAEDRWSWVSYDTEVTELATSRCCQIKDT